MEKTLGRIWGKTYREGPSGTTQWEIVGVLSRDLKDSFSKLDILTALLSLLNVTVRLVWELTLTMMTDAFLCCCWKHVLTPYKVEVRTRFAFVLNSFCVRDEYDLRSY